MSTTFRISNGLVGILNFLILMLSGPVIAVGIRLGKNPSAVNFLDVTMIWLGICLMAVSFGGLIGASFRITWLFWLYLVVMSILIGLVFCFTFIVTRGFRLGENLDWLQKRMSNKESYSRIKSSLIEVKICSKLDQRFNSTFNQFHEAKLTAVQSGCCKPSNDCGFSYVSPTNWRKNPGPYTNKDCNLWDNKPDVLCYDCEACKAGLLDNLRSSWTNVTIIDFFVLIFLIIVFLVACRAFKKNRIENAYGLEA